MKTVTAIPNMISGDAFTVKFGGTRLNSASCTPGFRFISSEKTETSNVVTFKLLCFLSNELRSACYMQTKYEEQ